MSARTSPRLAAVAAIACLLPVFGGGAGCRGPVMAGKDDPSYCPCAGQPTCPDNVRGSCSMADVLAGRPTLLAPARLCSGYLVLTDEHAVDIGESYVFDGSTGRLLASVSTPNESYIRRADGTLAPVCKCSGEPGVPVGRIFEGECTGAKAVALRLATGRQTPDAGAAQ